MLTEALNDVFAHLNQSQPLRLKVTFSVSFLFACKCHLQCRGACCNQLIVLELLRAMCRCTSSYLNSTTEPKIINLKMSILNNWHFTFLVKNRVFLLSSVCFPERSHWSGIDLLLLWSRKTGFLVFYRSVDFGGVFFSPKWRTLIVEHINLPRLHLIATADIFGLSGIFTCFNSTIVSMSPTDFSLYLEWIIAGVSGSRIDRGLAVLQFILLFI